MGDMFWHRGSSYIILVGIMAYNGNHHIIVSVIFFENGVSSHYNVKSTK